MLITRDQLTALTAQINPRYLPWFNVVQGELTLSRLARLSLFQVSVGICFVLLNGTLNRIMVVELGRAAWPASSNPTLHQKTSLRVIQEHLKLIATPYNEAGLSGMIALRALPSSQYQLFGLNDLPAAGAWAVSQNSDHGQNVYVAPGLFAHDTTGAGKDDDVIAQAYLFADADDGDQAARLLDLNHVLVCQQAFRVVTGTQPSMRLHTCCSY